MEIRLGNLGTKNRNMITIENNGKSVNLYFSYSTLVAVDNIVAENRWSKTTGRFLNLLQPDKKKRVDWQIVKKEAERRLKEVLCSKK